MEKYQAKSKREFLRVANLLSSLGLGFRMYAKTLKLTRIQPTDAFNALKKYGEHSSQCLQAIEGGEDINFNTKCICGLSQALNLGGV